MKDLIISLAVDGRERYSQKVQGLEDSIAKHWDGDVRIYKEFPEWCTPHKEIPYAFKYDLIEQAWKEGYRRIFWVDSSIRLLKNPKILLDFSDGIVAFHNLGHNLYPRWINDTAIKNLEATDINENVMQLWGGCVFWDFNKELAQEIFDEMRWHISIGSFEDDTTDRRGFVAHRNDQAVLSWLLHKRNIPLLPYGIIAGKQHITNETVLQYGD
jgi:hypothetical protein